jgi:hypothetical protein
MGRVTVHEEIHVLRKEDGVVAVITRYQQGGTPRYSFSFYKEYDRDGEIRRSHWLDRRHLASVRELTDEVDQWLALQEDRLRAARRVAR